MFNNFEYYQKAKNHYEPAVCEAINRELNSKGVVAFCPPAVMKKYKDGHNRDIIDYEYHIDIMIIAGIEDNCFGNGYFSVDVKTITPKSDKDINTNFSISFYEMTGKQIPDYFAFVYKNKIYIVNKSIVKENAFKKTSNFYLFPLKCAIEHAIFVGELSINEK